MNKSNTWLLVCAFSLCAFQVQAHHPVAAKFDASNPVTMTGRVTEISWANPHVHIFIQVDEAAGDAGNWAIELPSTVELERSGWTPEDLPIGDIITASGPAAINGSEQLWGNRISHYPDGLVLFSTNEDALVDLLANRPAGPTPQWPDGQPRLGPPIGGNGYWINTGSGSLYEEGQEIPMDALGMLDNINDAPRVAPFQDWALDLYRLRQANNLKDDPGFIFCIPPGGPRQFQQAYGIQLVEQRNRERLFVLIGGGNHNWRQIFTDDREQVSQTGGNDDNPLFFGRSRARWEGDSLVINSSGFNESFWFSNGGLPHTRLLQLEERLTRTDLNTLHYAVTINDPGAYTRPWTSSWEMQWVPGEEMPQYYCQDNRL